MNLSSPLEKELYLKDYQKKALKRLGLNTVKDLLWHFPSRYEEPGEYKAIADLVKGENVTLRGKIIGLDFEKTWQKKINIARCVLNDGTGMISIVWFHQPFIANMLKEGSTVAVSGKVQENKKGLYLANPAYEKLAGKMVEVDLNNNEKENLAAIYPETYGLSSRWFKFAIQKILKKILANEKGLNETLPIEILKTYHLPSLQKALIYIHMPQKLKDAEAARKRFSFEEIFLFQLSRIKKKILYKKQPTFSIDIDQKDLTNFIKNQFSFKLTGAQNMTLGHIIEDLEQPKPMSRFLEGDVGSGKTAIAAAASYAVFKNGYQTAYMAPTEILAQQLFESFTEYFTNSGAKIGLLTSSTCKKFPSKVNPAEGADISKNKLLQWIKEGEIDIIIGTHSLIQDKVKFSAIDKDVYKDKKLALVIIDEQHRFGTNQRAALVNKKNENDKNLAPHFLSMSATPIPRTLALTIYGDLDLTLLDEMPPGRKKVITEIVPPTLRKNAYEKIREELNKGRQAYVVCPRIEVPEKDTKKQKKDGKMQTLFNVTATNNLKAVKEEFEKLSKEIFPEYKIGMLYGKMNPKEKNQVMKDFEDNKIQVLIATSVVEVGVNVPNATCIIIEGAERFGLAQLHQLRGRVLRSTHQPYCYVFTESKTKRTLDRLKALKTAKNGFELAEHDLKFRGPGELSGKKQWGISDVGMEALTNIKMVEAAQTEAEKMLKADLELKNYPLLKEQIQDTRSELHLE